MELYAPTRDAKTPGGHSGISKNSLERYLLYVERRLALRSNSNCDLGGDAGLASSSPFPVVMLSYSDLVEACDTMQFLAARRHDAVLVFAPHFLIGNIEPLLTVLLVFILCFLVVQSLWRWRSSWRSTGGVDQ